MPRPPPDEELDRQLDTLIQSLRTSLPPATLAAQRARLLERMFGVEPGPVETNADPGPKANE